MKRVHKKVQQKPFSFQDWWEKQGYNAEHFKPCRAAWNAALAAAGVREDGNG